MHMESGYPEMPWFSKVKRQKRKLIVSKALPVLHAHQVANECRGEQPHQAHQPNTQQTVWKPPRSGSYKLYTDAGRAGNFNLSSVAAIWLIHYGDDARLAESLGLKQGLSFAKHLCLQNLEAESHCQEVNQAIANGAKHLSYFHSVIGDCTIVAKSFASCTFISHT